MNKIFSKYLSDPEVANYWSDENFIRKMLDTEIALAKAQAELGIIPKKAAREIETNLKDFQPKPELLTDGTMENGVPTIPLLALARKNLSAEAQPFLHWGATSQDMVDTATVLMIREVLDIFKKRLLAIKDHLKILAKQHQNTITVARTRTQQAVPITFAQKIDSWWQPIARHLERLTQLESRLLVVQLGGAGGNLSVLGDQGEASRKLLAKKLELQENGVWHNQRDGLVEFSNWLALVAGSFGKMAQDILLLAQTEIGEVIENKTGGGKSSTMPHKNNPVLSEAIVALTKYVGRLAGVNFETQIHQQERDGVSWVLEWLTFPQMVMATGTILKHALTISKKIKINKKAVQANLEKLNGLIYSEQARVILQEFKSRKEAQEIVVKACALALEQDIHLVDALARLLPESGINWKKRLQFKGGGSSF